MTNTKKIMKIGVIGRGKWGKKIIRTLKKYYKLEFIVGKNTNYKKIKKKIDWVFILTPNNTHYKISKITPRLLNYGRVIIQIEYFLSKALCKN